MKRKLIIFAGIILLVAVFAAMVRLADHSGYGKPAPPPRSVWTVSTGLPATNAGATTR
jgi:hypothetical protein